MFRHSSRITRFGLHVVACSCERDVTWISLTSNTLFKLYIALVQILHFYFHFLHILMQPTLQVDRNVVYEGACLVASGLQVAFTIYILAYFIFGSQEVRRLCHGYYLYGSVQRVCVCSLYTPLWGTFFQKINQLSKKT